MALAVLAALGLGGAGGGGFLLFKELTRKPTAVELGEASKKEVALRWRNWPVERIFPSSLTFQHADLKYAFNRVGIAPQANCTESVDQEAATVLTKYGCRGVLRATYVDSSGAGVLTLGVAVMPDADKATQASSDLGTPSKHGVRTVAYPGTVAEKFGDIQRQYLDAGSGGTYTVMVAAGYTDGRARLATLDNQDFFDFAGHARSALVDALSKEVAPCTSGAVQC